MTYILQSKRGPITIGEQELRSLKKIWPTKDVETELAKMSIWLLRYPKKQPVYFWTAVRNWLRKSPDVFPANVPPTARWWQSNDATIEMGRKVGVTPRPGEDWPSIRQRISDALRGSVH